MNPESAIIFTDGASRGNPGPGGWGAVLILNFKFSIFKKGQKSTGPEVVELGGREEHTTNNRMELTAAIKGLELGIMNYELCKRIYIYTDSNYLINGITKWIYGWKKKNWITSQKTAVENKDLWEKLDELTAGKNIDWKYVGGHVGITGNERCDVIATDFADGKKPKLFEGLLKDYPIKNILDLSYDLSNEKIKTESRARSRAKAYSYVSMIDDEIIIHRTWAECEKRVKGKSGAKFKKTLSASDEAGVVSSFEELSRGIKKRL